MKHASLFTGIGGFDLAAQWMGWENIFQCEIDNFCQRVLNKNFPNVKKFLDIKNFDGTEYTNKIDILSGGFPCQPFSVSGKQKGKLDNRYLWPEMFRVIKEIKPQFIVCENVTNIINLALDQVFDDLEAQGYTTEAFIIPACGVGAWHRRDRVWTISYNSSWDKGQHFNSWERECEKINEWDNKEKERGGNTISFSRNITGDRIEKREYRVEWETEPRMGRMVHGLSKIVDRTRRVEALGNAIVPQVAYKIFKCISVLEREGKKNY